MAIKYSEDYKWGQKIYLKSDPKQEEYLLVSITLSPGAPQYSLRRFGSDETEYTVYEFEMSEQRDEVKHLDNKNNGDDDS